MSKFYENMEHYIKAGFPCLWIKTWEEDRVLQELKKLPRDIFYWKKTIGWNDQEETEVDENRVIQEILTRKEDSIYILLDFHPYLKDNYDIIRAIKDVIPILKGSKRTLIFVSAQVEIPKELEKELVLIEYTLPNKEDLKLILSHICESVDKEVDENLSDKLVYSALGLTCAEAENVFAFALVKHKDFNEDAVRTVQEEKIKSLKKMGIEYYATDELMENVGGLEEIKEFFKKRKRSFTKEAREFGLPSPRGVFLLGLPGTGKSLIGKAIGNLLNIPILKFSMADILSSLVGESEAKAREFCNLAQTIAPVLIYADEFDKAFSGIESSGRSDAGTTSRVLGTFLTFMQENKEPVIWIATANEIIGLPPHIVRKGRFDELFFVDLPNYEERKEIVKIHLRKRKRNPDDFNINVLASETENFVGAEIEEGIIQAMFNAFDRGEDINTQYVLEAYKSIVPLSKTMESDVKRLRDWAKGKMRLASKVSKKTIDTKRKLEV